ncbi:unnamed protein product, partial [Amoebophrya sp. A25]
PFWSRTLGGTVSRVFSTKRRDVAGKSPAVVPRHRVVQQLRLEQADINIKVHRVGVGSSSSSNVEQGSGGRRKLTQHQTARVAPEPTP